MAKKKGSGKSVEYKRTSIDLPAPLVKKIKKYCITHEMTMKEFATEAFSDRLKKK